MITNSVRTIPPNARAWGGIQSTPVAAASVSLLNPARPQKAAPSHAEIAQKAYAIWLSQGQKPGSDQKNWFEAEL
jgi:hypothetical protein